MTRRPASSELWCLRIAVTAAVLLTAEVARADESTCEGADVRIEGQPDSRWDDVLGRLCADLEAMKDRDPDASLRISAHQRDLLLEVTLADGRSALRRVTRPLGLRSALEALLTLPPAPPSRRDAEPAPTAPTRADAAPAAEAAPREGPPPRAMTAELSASAIGRVAGAGFLSAGGGAEAYLSTGRWLFGLSARWDAFQTAPAPRGYDYGIETVGAGVALARQIPLGPIEIDVGFSPRFLVETESFEIPPRPVFDPSDEDDEEEDERARTTTDVRLAPFGRVLFGRGPVRFFVGLDAELSPARLRRKVRAAAPLPALPAWSAGLSLGVSWTAQ